MTAIIIGVACILAFLGFLAWLCLTAPEGTEPMDFHDGEPPE